MTDGKFSPSTALTGPNFAITPAMGRIQGNNLFHSFSQFNLATGETATFSGPANIQNVLSRVTGNSPSTIDGTLRCTIPNANLFLINPRGIIFGANASVDVSGSFAATTANYLKLSDGARFVAALDADDSGLTTAPVSAFGFLGNNPGSIAVQQSTLQNGKGITLVGGNIAIQGGSIQSPGGEINVASVRSAGEIPSDLGTLSAASLKSTFPAAGKIEIQNGSQLDASGDGGGRIVIRGGSLQVDNSKITANTTGSTAGRGIDVAVANDLTLANGGQIVSLSTAGLAAGGNIDVNAGSIHFDGGGAVDENFFPSTQISTSTGDLFSGGGPAAGGDITIHTGVLDMKNSAQISSASFGEGNAGRISIDATSVRMDAQLISVVQLSANTQQIDGGGNAGDINIHTGSLEVLNGATMFAASFGSGQAGRINIEADSVAIKSGSIITAAAFGSGNGGDVNVTAHSVSFDGRNSGGGPDVLTGIQAVTTAFDSPAPGGNIQINADTFTLDHMGSVFTTSYGLGTGGNIEVNAGNLTLANGSSIQAQGFDVGAAGTISLHARQNIVLSGDSFVSTAAPGSSGGDINIFAGSGIQLINSKITANAGLDGGNIEISAPNLIYLLNSTFNAQADSTGSGFGNGGNLTIDPSFLILNGSSLVSKSSLGNGGNISILADFFFQSTGLIDASAPFGLPGTVSVSAPKVDLTTGLVELPDNLFDASSLLRPDCGVRQTGGISSFVVLGRGGLPLRPGGFIPSGALMSMPYVETR